MKQLIYIAFFVFFVSGLNAQNYIGLHKSEIKKRMKTEFPKYGFDKEIDNGNKSFVKYVRGIVYPETLLFVLWDTGKCRYILHMYEDPSKLNKIRKQFNENYEKLQENKWLMKENDQYYEISIEEREYFFSVITRKHELE